MMLFIILVIALMVITFVVTIIIEKQYQQLESEVLKELGFSNWNIVSYFDEKVIVKSRQTLEKYDDIKFFKENKEKLVYAEDILIRKKEVAKIVKRFLDENEFKNRFQYNKIIEKCNKIISNAGAYRICVRYITKAGNNLGEKEISLSYNKIKKFKDDPSLLMGKGEYNKYLKEQTKEALSAKHHEFYEKVNRVIDYANENKEHLVIKNSKEEIDNLVAKLFDRTVNSIKKIKTVDSEEWDTIEDYVSGIERDIKSIVDKNNQILNYYKSSDFTKIKETCDNLMSTQKEFNEYINEKAQSIAGLFGKRLVRNETVTEDEYDYIRPYKKTITPFTAEVSATVFASAENSPLEYIVKYFYPNKELYPEQIQKLHLLVEELETLREAKQIIDNYKKEYDQYIQDVPSFIMENDETGFYSRLGFANIDESVLTIEYKFAYTSNGGMAQRYFTIPMVEETIVELIKILESKLTMSSFAKEQRSLMTKKLRQHIKERDNFTCCNCGNSTHAEPNLLLEIDHIVPVAKGGCTVEDNLQTLCWKCNRAKSDKLV